MGLVDGAAERCRRGIHLPLSQPQLRQTGLRRPSPPARLAVRLLGFRELAAQSMQLGLLIEGRTHPRLARWVGEPVAFGRFLRLDTATYSTLGHEREQPAVLGWNIPA